MVNLASYQDEILRRCEFFAENYSTFSWKALKIKYPKSQNQAIKFQYFWLSVLNLVTRVLLSLKFYQARRDTLRKELSIYQSPHFSINFKFAFPIFRKYGQKFFLFWRIKILKTWPKEISRICDGISEMNWTV